MIEAKYSGTEKIVSSLLFAAFCAVLQEQSWPINFLKEIKFHTVIHLYLTENREPMTDENRTTYMLLA